MMKEDAMKVAQYTFQSPYSSPVQVGRLDPNSVKDDSSKNSAQTFNAPNETLQKAQSFEATQRKDVQATVAQNRLDIYA